MKLIELIKTRRTIHQFESRSVDAAWIRQAIELALWSPNHRLTLPWRFVDIGPQSRQMVAEIAIAIKSQKKPVSEIEREALLKNYRSVSHLLLVAQPLKDNAELMHEDFATIAMGIQNMSLYLWQQGIGSKWSTGAVTKDPRVLELCHLAPEKFASAGFLWVGYPERVPAAAPRPKVEEIFSEIP